jgi:O-antigen/teichoic acid export membrane protein
MKRRVLGAGLWTLAGYAVSYPIRLGSNLITTRLLAPEMFGVMAIAWLLTAALVLFSDVGLEQNIVQSRRGSDPDFLNTAWSIQIIRGVLVLLLGLCISAGLFTASLFRWVPEASVYADPHLPPVLAVASLGAAIWGFQSTKVAEAHRLLSLGRVTQIGIIGQIVTVVCTIGWALIERSIWALVAGNLCSTAITMLLSHVWLPGVTNRWRWDRSAVHEIVHFGKWIFLSSILGFFAGNADRMLLGAFVASPVLGIYSIASNIARAIGQLLNIIPGISFPAFSEVVRDRPSVLKRYLYRFHIPIASFAYLSAGLLFVSGNSIIGLLYDARYHQAGWMLEILAIGLLAVPFQLSVYSLLARGLSKLFSNVVAIRTAATIVLIPLGFHFFGVGGAVWGIVAGSLSSVPAIIFYQYKHGLLEPLVELLLLPILFMGMLLGQGLNVAIGR